MAEYISKQSIFFFCLRMTSEMKECFICNECSWYLDCQLKQTHLALLVLLYQLGAILN